MGQGTRGATTVLQTPADFVGINSEVLLKDFSLRGTVKDLEFRAGDTVIRESFANLPGSVQEALPDWDVEDVDYGRDGTTWVHIGDRDLLRHRTETLTEFHLTLKVQSHGHIRVGTSDSAYVELSMHFEQQMAVLRWQSLDEVTGVVAADSVIA
jgi:hypothetical protein